MVSPVHTENRYVLADLGCSVSALSMRITRFSLSLITLGSGAVIAEDFINSNLPSYVYPISYCTAVLSLSALAFTCAFRNTPPLKSTEPVPLLKPQEVARLKASELIHELCEIQTDGTPQPCSISRMKVILEELRTSKSIQALNSIPEYSITKAFFSKYFECKTPLQYWAARGNLEAVKLLTENGAADYPIPQEDSGVGLMTSALYDATKHGHHEIVSYFLKQRAQPITAFNNNLLFSFIPKLVFDFYCTEEAQIPIAENFLHCVELILNHLASHPDNLILQLQIPIQPGKNALAWLTSHPQSQEKTHFIGLLSRFGAVNDDVLSNDDLRQLGDIGTGHTLQEIASFK